MKYIIFGIGNILDVFVVETCMKLGKDTISHLDRNLFIRDDKV